MIENKIQTERNIIKVIKSMIVHIPEKETKLLNDLDKYYHNLWFIAPELREGYECWKPLQNILNINITSLDEEWKHTIRKIFNDEK
jgi:hypothetical protein